MSWTKEQFIEFCNRAGVNPAKALQEGVVPVREAHTTAATKAKTRKQKNHARRTVAEIQDSLREHHQAMALEEEIHRQAGGLESPKTKYRISIIGHRVRPIDPDNFGAGCKGIVDGIVKSRLISGDDWNTVEVSTSQTRIRNPALEGTKIVIESIDE